ncbi:MAG TPA: DUF2125 domain-containing protein [Microvirga sp.]|jgi:hypothetical protein
MAHSAAPAAKPYSRFWLYTPFLLLALVAVAWSVAWFVIRGRAGEALDRLLAAEAGAGREWTCTDRRIGGYPFRIEVACAQLTLKHGALTGSFGRVQSVAQVYQPRHVITDIAGPLTLTDGQATLEARWRLLETSVRASSRGFERGSLVAEEPQIRVTGPGLGETALASGRLEAHLRPNPARAPEGAYDAAISATQARLPGLDALIGGGEPTDLQIDLTATQAQGFRGRPVVEEVERWRQAGGRLDVLQLALAKGARRVQAKGELRLDELHRPAGEFAVSAAGVEGLIGAVTGGRIGGNLLGALLGQPAPAAPAATPNQPALTPLPPLRLDNGRLAVGPFVIPNLRLPPLY